MTNPLVDLGNIEPCALINRIVKAKHRLAESGLFTDESLLRIIDSHPREFCNVSRMGYDKEVYEWGEGDTTGLSAEEMLHAVKIGRMWINVRRMMWYHDDFRKLILDLYADLQRQCPEFKTMKHSANLLISSPSAMVYYHFDAPQNMLWHVRGKKRVWVYPLEDRFLKPEHREAVIAGDREEDLPYSADFDDHADVYDMGPGDLVTWPQNAPHRVENLEGLNVSLSTEHYTATQLRYARVNRANYYLRTRWGLPCRALNTSGPGYAAKFAGFLALRSVGKFLNRTSDSYEYPMTFRVDPDAPGGAVELNNTGHVKAAVESEQELVAV